MNKGGAEIDTQTSEIEQFARDYAAAWSSGDPAAVAAHFSADRRIAINRGEPLAGTAAISEMAAGFHAEFPDLKLLCDDIRVSGDHAVFVWTLEGHHAETKNFVSVGGWEEWDLSPDLKVQSSKGWFDEGEYDRQIAEGHHG